MKRSILFSALGMAAMAAAFAGHRAYAAGHAPALLVASGEACVVNGRSGYMVATGRSGELTCQEDPALPGGE
ncbi:MAG: hypothetical protein M3Y64_05800 [Gemmatimonadota bacterium]|nr:hypothetical protein [Gemmatimonadota bacterium]